MFKYASEHSKLAVLCPPKDYKCSNIIAYRWIFEKDDIRNFQTQYEKFTFKVGDLVIWEKGLKHKKVPDYGVPAVVLKVLETPIIDEESPISSPYYKEELDILLGIMDEEGDFICFYYDSKRFKSFQQTTENV